MNPDLRPDAAGYGAEPPATERAIPSSASPNSASDRPPPMLDDSPPDQTNARDDAPSLKISLLRGLLLKCPKCGVGGVFRSYLKREDACPHCRESFEGIEADDGPAWLTIGVAAHIVVPLLILLETKEWLSYGAEMAVLLLVTIASVLLFLPVCKGLFIAAIWSTSRKTD